jgi:apolipoprotein N-acyltransferase
VVWAETAVPAYVRYDRALMEWVRGTARDNAVPILTGFPDAELIPGTGQNGVPRRYEKSNSAGLFSAHGTLQSRYAKHHLLPIGESMPFQRWLPFLGGIDVGQAEWTPGPPPGPMIVDTPRGDVSVFTVICFEAVFGDLARQAVRRGATVMVNITNDGWFGLGSGPRQHAALARIRAAECGVPLVRSANNGISMICDQQGDILTSLDLHRRGVVVATIDPVARPTWFVRLGAWPALAGLVTWSLAGCWLARRRAEGMDDA